MSGETEADVSGWTVDTLRAHIVGMLAERDRRYAERWEAQEQAMRDRDAFLERLAIERQAQVASAFAASQTAIDKAEKADAKRFDAQNEFRGQLGDQARTFMPRPEAELQFHALAARLATLEQRAVGSGERSEGRREGWGYLVGGVGVLVAVMSIVALVVKL